MEAGGEGGIVLGFYYAINRMQTTEGRVGVGASVDTVFL